MVPCLTDGALSVKKSWVTTYIVPFMSRASVIVPVMSMWSTTSGSVLLDMSSMVIFVSPPRSKTASLSPCRSISPVTRLCPRTPASPGGYARSMSMRLPATNISVAVFFMMSGSSTPTSCMFVVE